MTTLVTKVLNFLWVTVWGKINLWQFLKLNKQYLILAGSNVILSLLFIYMAEQVTVRTDQYRALKTEIKNHDNEVKIYKDEITLLEKQNKTLIVSFGLKNDRVDTKEILNDYEKWATQVRKIESDIQNAATRLGEKDVSP